MVRKFQGKNVEIFGYTLSSFLEIKQICNFLVSSFGRDHSAGVGIRKSINILLLNVPTY